MVLSYDPGLRQSGLGVFKDGVLVYATLVRSPVKKERDGAAWCAMGAAVKESLMWAGGIVSVDVLVSEIPQVYWGKRGGNADDLIQLAGVVGAVAHAIPHSEFKAYRPREWKGNVKAEVMLERIEARLSEDEAQSIVKCPASLRHNVLDAVGIGLKYLGRL